jgi:hypothetical protein
MELKIKRGDAFISGVVGVAGPLLGRQGIVLAVSPFPIFRMNHREMVGCAPQMTGVN